MNSLKTGPVFHLIDLSDRSILQHYLGVARKGSAFPVFCDYTFATLYLWRHLYKAEWAIVADFLVVRACCFGGDKRFYLQPLYVGCDEALVAGDSSIVAAKFVADVLPVLKVCSESFGKPFRMGFLRGDFASALSENPDFYVYENRDYANYVYRSESLSLLSGRKLQPKRNHVHQFLAEYPDYQVRLLQKSDSGAALSLLDRWEQGLQYENAILLAERDAIADAFEHYDELGLEGLLLSVPEGDGRRPVAFCFGSPVSEKVFCTHVEKADPSCKNAFAMINKLMADHLKDRFDFINREEDLGELGLRRAKLSYHPEQMVEAWFLMEKSSEEYKIWKLWQEAFDDSDSFLASYIYPYSTPDARILFYEDDDPQKELVAMCHVHYFDSDFGVAAYLYALAVSKKARGRGLGTLMVGKILERARTNGAKLLWAVQGNLNYNAWEHSLGFFAPQMDVSELDFGTEFLQESFGVEPGEISDERALVKCFDGETEKAVRNAKPPFKLALRS